MNEKLRALRKLFNFSDEFIRANKKLIDTLIKDGDTPGPGPEPPTPTPTVIIVFNPHNNETEFNVESNEEIINCVVDSTIEGVYVPFTASLKTENNWCTLSVNNNTLQISVTKNTVENVRECIVVVTQQELLGEQKSFELEIVQAAAEPVLFDFIANNALMNFSFFDTVLLNYIFNEAPNAEKKNITSGGSPIQVLDPKCLKTYNAFGTHTGQYKNNTNITNACLLGFTKTTNIPGSAFEGCSKLNKVLIPESCTVINDNAFRYCGSYESSYHVYVKLNVYFLSSTPPQFLGNPFNGAMIGNIYVPIGSADAYKQALPDFAKYIVESNTRVAGEWSNNTSFKYDDSEGYNKSVESMLSFDEIMNYINK